jgi:hypothetical protein
MEPKQHENNPVRRISGKIDVKPVKPIPSNDVLSFMVKKTSEEKPIARKSMHEPLVLKASVNKKTPSPRSSSLNTREKLKKVANANLFFMKNQYSQYSLDKAELKSPNEKYKITENLELDLHKVELLNKIKSLKNGTRDHDLDLSIIKSDIEKMEKNLDQILLDEIRILRKDLTYVKNNINLVLAENFQLKEELKFIRDHLKKS